MAQVTGTDGHDILYGTTGADLIKGLAGDDYIWSRAGDDHLLGGEGNDVLEAEGGSDLLEGEGGNDRISASQSTHAGEHVVARGGAGEDQISFSLFGAGGGVIEADGGDGNDTLWVKGLVTSTALLTLGAGRDSIRFHTWYQGLGQSSILVTDFQPGAGGDRIDWDLYLDRILSGWDPSTNPFAGGYLRLTSSGADTLLEIDTDGAAGGAGFSTLLTFQNVAAAALTAENLGGYPSNGGPIVGVTISGGTGRDEIRGTAGDDVIDGLGGNDQLFGGLGDDTLRGSDGDDDLRGEDDDDILEGGIGADTLQGAAGDDRVYGGEGNDFILSFEGGADEVYGEGGNDEIRFGQSSSAQSIGALMSGGAGDDRIQIQMSGDGGSVTVDGGPGVDTVILIHVYLSTASITLGGARDILQLSPSFAAHGSTIVQDFVPGNFGDYLDWLGFLGSGLVGWDGAANPFATGHLRLVQSGSDTRLEVDVDGPNTWGHTSYETLLTFRNASPWSFTATNFAGFAPDGSLPAALNRTGTLADETLQGGVGSDTLDGAGGNDTILGSAGHDTLRGGDANDTVNGDLGNDLLEGGAGADILNGGFGNDEVYGGEGDDRLSTSAGAIDELYGEAGNDTLIVSHTGGDHPSQTSGDQVLASGGVGDDTFFLRSDNRSFLTVDAGAGNDIVNLQRSFLATFTITLGEGRDTVRIQSFYAHENVTAAIITDFTAGASGDTLDWDQFLASSTLGWNGTDNPFAAGYVRLLQNGADTLVQLDWDASGTSGSFKTVLTLTNVTPHFFEAGNFDGFDPHSRFVVTGTAGADTLAGTAGRDSVDGGAGNDLLLLQDGGDDTAYAGAGNDVLYFGAAFTGSDRADGGADRDAIVLQGNYALTLSDANFTGIESLSLQSGENDRWGDTANNFYDYDITTADGNVPAGVQMIVNGQSLRVGEDLTFDGSAESDGKFLIYAGHGVDTLTGGAGGDVFFFEGTRWGTDDTVDGGGGRDSVVISAGSGLNRFVFGETSLTSIESISVNARFVSDPTQKPRYELVLANGNVAPGATLILNGNSLTDPSQFLHFDGRAVRDGNLALFGGAAHDTLRGGSGADLLYGARGADSLIGGAGGDTFRYDAVTDSLPGLPDTIADFAVGLDKVDLSRIDANSHAGGNQAFSFIGANAFSGLGAASAGELRVFASNGKQWAEGDIDGNGTADFAIAFQVGAAPLSASDFLL